MLTFLRCILFVSIGMLMLASLIWIVESPTFIESFKEDFNSVVCQGTNLTLDGKVFSIPMFSIVAFSFAVELISLSIASFLGRSICKCIYNGETPFQHVIGEKNHVLVFFY